MGDKQTPLEMASAAEAPGVKDEHGRPHAVPAVLPARPLEPESLPARPLRLALRARNAAFVAALALVGSVYVLLIVAMLAADALFTSPGHLLDALASPEIRFSVWLSLISSSITAILSVWVAVPLGYLLARYRFPGQRFVDALLDVPIVLPPLVVGLSLLILFHLPLGTTTLEGLLQQRLRMPVTYAVPAVILAQFAVACAFAVRTMRATFDQLSPRAEQVARTLGCTQSQAFWRVALPEARRGIVTAGTLAWSRALGEFGPILVFAGATRMQTEVLSTSVFLELSVGNLKAAVAVSLLMVVAAVVVLVIVRLFGSVESTPAERSPPRIGRRESP